MESNRTNPIWFNFHRIFRIFFASWEQSNRKFSNRRIEHILIWLHPYGQFRNELLSCHVRYNLTFLFFFMLNLIQQCFTDRIIGESAWFFIVYLCTSVSNTHSKIRKRWGFDFVGDFCFFLRFFLNYQQSHFCYSITNWKQKITSAISFLYLFFSSFRNSSSKCGTERFSFMKTKK